MRCKFEKTKCVRWYSNPATVAYVIFPIGYASTQMKALI